MERQHRERDSELGGQPRKGPRISLLGGFQLEDAGTAIVLPEGAQRLLALLALRGRLVKRPVVAGTLWPVATEGRASASLRTALARLPGHAGAAVKATARDLGLSDRVSVDLWDSRTLAHRLLAPQGLSGALDPGPEAVAALSAELLPGWFEEWVLIEAEDWRQLRLHALEALAERLTAQGHYGDAAAAALAAVRGEPLRESPRAALIRVHIAEGNPSEALREFARYGELLMLELGVEPTQRLRSLVAKLGAVTPRQRADQQAAGMNQRSPVALLTIRAWCEDRSDDPLRAEIRLTNDVSSGFQQQRTVADTEKVIEAVQAFLDDVLS